MSNDPTLPFANDPTPGGGQPGETATPGGSRSPALAEIFESFKPEKPGDFIGPYRLIEILGEGGFGIVWRAEQTQPVRREVALKVIKPGMDSREIIARFEAERQALALMDHPNIARMFEAGATPAGRPYFAMEFVKGEPVTMFCDEHKLSLEERIPIFTDVCAAVQHAHHKAILHRDLKPTNILVSEINGQFVPKVIDFGVAKALGQQLSDKTLVTMMGLAVGTPQYMSPEQAGVQNMDVDTRSDVYSLGVILYELLTGSTPLSKETVRKLLFNQVQDLMRTAEPERPSTRLQHQEQATQQQIAQHRKMDTSRLQKRLRGDLDWIVMRAIEKDRSRRYQTVNALALDLRRHLNGDIVEAGPPSARYRLGKLARRYRGALVAASVVLASIFAGLGFTIWQAVRATRAEKLASQRFTEAQGARDAAEELTTEAILGLRKKLMALGKIEIMEDMVAAADDYYKKLPAELKTDLSERHRASLYTNRALIAAGLGRDTEQEQYAREALRIADQLAVKNPGNDALQDEAAYANLTLCVLYMDRNDNDSLLESTEEVIARCKNWLQDHPKSIWAMRYQVLAHNLAGHALTRYLGKPLEGMVRFQTAAQLTRQMREVAGETADVCEAEGLIHYGNANIAGRTGQKAQETREFEASTASFARALELGGDSALLRELHVGAMHHAGMGIRYQGLAGKNAAEIQRGEAMIIKAYEGRARLVELEPGRAEWWRDLAYSHHILAGLAAEKQDAALELSHRKECLRCRMEAVTRQKNRPLLHVEWANAASDLAECLMKQVPPDRKEAADLTLRSLESWRRGVEMAGMLTVNSRMIKGDAARLAKIVTAEDPASALALLTRARGTIEPIAGKVQGANDAAATLATLLGTQIDLLASLGRTAEAAEAKAALSNLSSGKDATPRGTIDVAKFLLDSSNARLDAAGKLPADRQPAELARVEADTKQAISLLEPLAAREDNPDYRGTLGYCWRSLARTHKAQKKFSESGADYQKAIDLFSDEKYRSQQGDSEHDLADLLRENRDFASSSRHFAAAAKVRDALAEAPAAAAASFNRASMSWSGLSSVQHSLGDRQAARASIETSLARQTRAHKLEPENVDYHSRLINLLFMHARLLALLQQGAEAMASVDRSAAEVPAHLPTETDLGRITQLNDSGSEAHSKLRDIKAYPAAEKLLRQVIAVRQRMEALRAWPEDPAKSSIGAQVSLAGLLHDQKRDAESASALAEALAAADRSARPAIIAEANIRARGHYDTLGKHDEAEHHARAAYAATQQADLGHRALPIAADFALTLAKRRQFAEAEKAALAAWDSASTRTWPDEPVKLRHDLAGKIAEFYRYWNSIAPSDDRGQKAREWRERQAQALPLDNRLADYDLSTALLVSSWRMAGWIEAGKLDECKRERTRLLRLMADRQHIELAQRAARFALLLPSEGDELTQAARLADFAFKATPASSGNYEWYALAQGLALVRQNKGREALAVLQPGLKTATPDRWFSVRALCALAHHQLGEADKAAAKLHEIDKAGAAALGYFNDPINDAAAIARVLVSEARRTIAP